MKYKKKWAALEAILKILKDSAGYSVKEISKALNTAGRKLQYSMYTKNSLRSETDKSKRHRDKKKVYSTYGHPFFGMSMVVIISMLLFAGAGEVSALTITEDYTVIENQTINEDLTLDGASHCTIRNNIIHGRLSIFNFSEYATISNNTVDDLIYNSESAYSTMTGNHMGGYYMDSPKGGTSPKYRYDQNIDTSNLVKGKPLYYYFDIHDTVIENLTNIGQLFIAVSSNVTIRNLNMDTAGIFFKACSNCVITDCVVNFPTSDIYKVGWAAISLDNSGSITVKNNTITLSGSRSWGIYGDTAPNSVFSNNTISVSSSNNNARCIHIYCSKNVKVINSTLTATGNAQGLAFAYPTGTGVGFARFDVISTDINGSVVMGGVTASIGNVYLTDTQYSSLNVQSANWIAHRLWYLDAKVTNSAGDSVELATVTATDKNGVMAFSVITDANGNIPQQSLLEYTQTETQTTHSTPYTITATKSGKSDSKSINITESATLSFNLGEVPPDTIPPAAVNDLSTSKPTSDSITLTWTAPGSDGNIGTASQYDIRYSTSPITSSNWDSATQCAGEPVPQVSGSAETFTVPDLAQNTAYYFALKAADDIPNWANISNSPSETTAEIIEGLVGHWKFDEGNGETAYDSSGDGNDGMIYGAGWTTGVFGSALAFDGYNDRVNCGSDNSLNINGTKTIIVWIKIPTWASYKAPWSKYIDGGNRVLFQTWPDQKMQLWVADNGVKTIQMPTDVIPLNEWTQIAVTIDESNQVAKIYQNGVYVNQDTSFTLPDTSAADFIVGSSGAGGRYFNGYIDDVRIYNYALSDAEVLALYQEGMTPPYTSGHSPAKNATGVSKDTNIVVHIRDDVEGVNQSSIVMTVEGTQVTATISGTPKDYTLTYTPSTPFDYEQVVDVTIKAEDLAFPANIMPQVNYTFTIESEPTTLPEAFIDSITPDPAEQGKDTVSFSGYGNGINGSIVAYSWSSNIDGKLSAASTFSKPASELSGGTHMIYFKVQDDAGTWSAEVTDDLMVIDPANLPPYRPANPLPSDSATGVPVDVVLSWTGGDPDAEDTVIYDVYFGTSISPPLVVENHTGTTYDLDTLDHSTNYYWQIVATDNHGASTKSEVWSFTTATPCSGLAAEWHLDDGNGTTAADTSGNGNNGTLVNNPAWADGKIDKALRFDGTNDYVHCGQGSSLKITGAITVEAWVNWTGAGNPYLVTKTGGHGHRSYDLSGNEDGTVEFRVGGADCNTMKSSGTITIPAGEWVHLAGTYEPSSYVRLFVDGALAKENIVSIPGSQGDNGLSWYIGAREGNQGWFNGTIDEVKIYNRALSADEIRADYEDGSSNQPPVADPNNPYIGIEGVPLHFKGNGSYDPDGSIVAYLWTFGDGNTSSEVNPTHIYVQDDSYNITLTVTDNEGATNTNTTMATIADTEPTANFSAMPTSGPEPLTVTFTDNSTSHDGLVTWEWDFNNDGETDSTVQNPTYEYAEEGVYTVSLMVNESDGDSDSMTRVEYISVIRVNNPPVADPNGPYTGMELVPLQFNGSGSYDPDGSIVSYLWDFGDGNNATEATPTHIYAQNGTYNVTLTVTDNEGATDTSTTTADIESDLIPPYTTGYSPAKDAIEVAKNTTIVVHVKDDGAGVDITSIVMTVNGITVTPIITGTPADYTLTYVPSVDFECGQIVNVTVDAHDLATAP
jgi:PKD repeat protein